MKKIVIILLIVGGVILVASVIGVIYFVLPMINKPQDGRTGGNDSVLTGLKGPCKEESVQLENYGDPGKRLNSCFVEYPGEPTRDDKSYYIVEDICGQFNKEFVEYLTGKTFVALKAPASSSVYACTYYFNGKSDDTSNTDFYIIVLDYLNFERQKAGHEILGRIISTDSRIQMDHFISTQEDGNINRIVLKLSDDKFLGIDRGSASSVSNEEILNFSIKLSEQIQDYK